MSFEKALERANKRVYRKLGDPVYLFNDVDSIDTHGIFDEPEHLEKLQSLSGKQSSIQVKDSEKLLSFQTPVQDVKGWTVTIDNMDYEIKRTLNDGAGETICILAQVKQTQTQSSEYGRFG